MALLVLFMFKVFELCLKDVNLQKVQQNWSKLFNSNAVFSPLFADCGLLIACSMQINLTLLNSCHTFGSKLIFVVNSLILN